jgi:GNAT superfamily N-acetyltransferase
MRIRPANESDTAGLAALLQTLGNDLPRLAGEPYPTALARVLSALDAKTDHTLLVADAGGVAGFIHTVWQPSLLRTGGEGFVTALFVHPERRGEGLGQKLLAEIRAEAEQRGCSRLMLVNMRDRPSYERGFYTKQGWTERQGAINFVLEFPVASNEP